MKHDIKNTLYHFTTFESAVKILASNELLFGRASRKNDIAEVHKEIISNKNSCECQEVLKEYQYLSFTQNSKTNKGFEIDALWGHYAEKGNGVCLAFDKLNLIEQFCKQFPRSRWRGNIKYRKNHSNASFLNCEEDDNIYSLIKTNRQELFFEKSMDWKYECEYRLLVKSVNDKKLDIRDCLKGVIIHNSCTTKDVSITDTIQYKVFSKLVRLDKLFHYHQCFGNKELYNYNDTELIYPIIGKDYELDIH